MSHPLDRPVWSALTTGWAHHAWGDDRARRIDPDYGPFAAAADGSAEAIAALGALILEGRDSWIVEADAIAPPAGTRLVKAATCLQMVAADSVVADPDFAPDLLGDADAPAMRALAHLTEPGPFLPLTHRLARFHGIRDGARLIAMAGERMQLDGFAEISGVCTHPDARGRGLAGALTAHVARRIAARGRIPFLHVYAGNEGAVRLYRALGFTVRREVVLTVLARDITPA